MANLPYLAPVFILFEIWQLVMGERYLGIKQIARGADPRALGLGEITAFFWTVSLCFYWAWMFLLIFSPNSRIHGLGLVAISMLGFAVRRGAPLKWMLVVLTFEGGIRIPFLGSLCLMLWWHR